MRINSHDQIGKFTVCKISEWTNAPTTHISPALATMGTGGMYMQDLVQVRIGAAPIVGLETYLEFPEGHLGRELAIAKRGGKTTDS